MTESIVLVDAHVHIHASTDVQALLESAVRNFAAAALKLGAGQWHGALLLTEMPDAQWYAQVSATGVQLGRWTLQIDPHDPMSLVAETAGQRLVLVPGRQIVTSEGIEVLSLGTTQCVADRQSLDATLSATNSSAALSVLPWAVGKWLGGRGKRVRGALDTQLHPVHAGDNGGRPWFWPTPAQFAVARTHRRLLLSGSDPLPLARDELRVGSFGSWYAGALPEVAAGKHLLQQLNSIKPEAVRPFGKRQGAVQFLRNQIGLRLGRSAHRAPSKNKAMNLETPDIETSSADYARRFSGPAGRYLLQTQSNAVRAALRGLPPGKALDVGGGHGQLVELLRELGWQVTVHGTADTCEYNLRNLHGKHDCSFLKGDLFQLPVEDNSFDLVIAVRLISHVDAWPRLVAELCRVSRGSVVIDYPAKSALNALTPLLFGLKKSLEGNTRTYTSFSKSQLREEFARHRFGKLRQVKQFFMPMVVHRVGKGMFPFRAAEIVFRTLGLTAAFGSPVILRMDKQ